MIKAKLLLPAMLAITLLGMGCVPAFAQGPFQRIGQRLREIVRPNQPQAVQFYQSTQAACTGPECANQVPTVISSYTVPSVVSNVPTPTVTIDSVAAGEAVTASASVTTQQISFRRQLLRAAELAQREGQISRLDVLKLRIASGNTAILARMEAAAADQYRFESGSTAQAIDWDGLTNFIKEILPLIVELIKLFGHVPTPAQPVYAYHTHAPPLELAIAA